ncbi:MAG: trigger factor [bacterium]
MEVKHEVSPGENWRRDLKIEVSAEEVQNRFDEIYQQLRTEAKIPGFRPGKVPMKTIKSRFRDVAAKEVFENLMDESFRQALKDSGLDAISPPQITDVTFEEGKPLIYTAQLDVRPEIKLEKYTGFDLKKPSPEVSEAEVDGLLDYLRRQNAEMVAVERPAQLNDFVIANLEVLSETSGNLKEKEFENVQIELLDEGLPQQFLEHLKGKQTGETPEFEIAYPPDHFDKRFAGSTVRFKATIDAIKELRLPELDEEFFKQFGDNVASVDDLKERLRGSMMLRKEKEAEDALREEVMKEVIDKNRFELPESMITNFLDNLVDDYRERSKEEIDETKLREQYRAYAIRQIRWNLLYHEIATAEKIVVKQEDLDAWMQRFADNYNMTLDEAKEQIADSRKVADVRETILESRVMDFIIAASEQETVATPPEPDGDADARRSEEQ